MNIERVSTMPMKEKQVRNNQLYNALQYTGIGECFRVEIPLFSSASNLRSKVYYYAKLLRMNVKTCYQDGYLYVAHTK